MNTDRECSDSQESGGVERSFDCLAKARIELGLSTEEVADYLKITESYVTAMEQGQFEQLPAPAFVRGYLKNYAKLLGLDPVQLASYFDACIGLNDVDKPSFTGRLPLEKRSFPVFRYLATLVSLLIVAVGSYVWWNDTHKVEQVISAYENTELDATSLSVPESVPVSGEDASDDSEAVNHAVSETIVSVDDGLEDSGSPVRPEAGEMVDAMIEPVAADEQLTVPADTATLFIRFKEDCWMEVKDMSGKVIVSGIKKAGSELDLEVPSSVRLRLGNAPGVDTIRFGDHAVDISAGRAGKKLAKLTLNAFEQG